MNSQDSVKITNITKKYGNKKVLDDISVSIRDGEVLALLGHNGAGKTTLIKIISGNLDADEGLVEIACHTD